MKTDIYQRVTDQIVSELEKGVRPWLKPWNAEHTAGRIARPLRGNGIPYKGINVLMLWSASMEKGYAAPMSVDRGGPEVIDRLPKRRI
jgi:antirestriction protein ArdC